MTADVQHGDAVWREMNSDTISTGRLTAWGIGICPFDFAHQVERTPRAGEKIDALQSTRGGGGPVPTAMAVIAKLGGRSAVVGVVGDDPMGVAIRDDLVQYGVDISGLRVEPGAQSAMASLIVEKGTGQRTAIFDHGTVSNPTVSEEWIEAHPARYMLTDARTELGMGDAVRSAKQRGCEIVLDIGSPREPDPAAWEAADHLVMAAGFARWKTGHGDPEGAARQLWHDGLKSLVMTLGSKGAYLYTPDISLFHPAFNVELTDVTGAGDTFHGAYIYALSQDEWSWVERVRFATAAGSLACRGLGVRGSLPTLEEVETLVNQ